MILDFAFWYKFKNVPIQKWRGLMTQTNIVPAVRSAPATGGAKRARRLDILRPSTTKSLSAVKPSGSGLFATFAPLKPAKPKFRMEPRNLPLMFLLVCRNNRHLRQEEFFI